MAIFTSDSGSFYDLKVSSSLTVTGSTFLTLNTTSSAANVVMVNPTTGQLYYTASTAVANASVFPYTGSAVITGSLTVTGSTTSTLGFTGSLLGTASFVSGSVHGSTNPALSASYASGSTSASFALSASRAVSSSYALSASYASGSTSASYASSSTSASYAQTANTASNIIATVPSTANTSYYITFVTSSQNNPQPIYVTGNLTYNNTTQALNATSSWAASASVAISSSYVATASLATTSSYALTASFVLSSSYAATASFVLSSSYALTASYAPLAAQVQGGANNYIPLWSDSTQLTSSVMYQSGSKVGIGTGAIIPSATLQVNGGIVVGQSGGNTGQSIDFVRTDGNLMNGMSAVNTGIIQVGGGNINFVDVYTAGEFTARFGNYTAGNIHSLKTVGGIFASGSSSTYTGIDYFLKSIGSGQSGSLNVDNTLYVSGGYVSVGTTTIGAGVLPTSNFGTTKEIYAAGGFNIGSPGAASYVKTGMYGGSGNSLGFWSGNGLIATLNYAGGSGTSTDSFKIAETYNASSGTGTVSALRIIGSTQPAGANSVNYNQIYITPAYSQSIGTGAIRGIYYAPTIQTLGSSTHTAIETTSGNVVFGGNTITASISGSLIVSGASLTFDIPSKGLNKVLTSDANGGATWATPTAVAAATYIATGSVTASVDVGSTIFQITSASITRTSVDNRGIQRWLLNNGTTESGVISFTTPSSYPGIILASSGSSFSSFINRFNFVNAETYTYLGFGDNTSRGNLAILSGSNNVVIGYTGTGLTGVPTNRGYLLDISGSSTSGSLNVDNTLYVSASKVGIGTNTPTYPLDLQAGSSTTIAKLQNSNGSFIFDYVSPYMRILSQQQLNITSLYGGSGPKILIGVYGGNSKFSTAEVNIGMGAMSFTDVGTARGLYLTGQILSTAGGTNYNMMEIVPDFAALTSGGSGSFKAVYYNPTISTGMFNSSHVAFENTKGDNRFNSVNSGSTFIGPVTSSLGGEILVVSGSAKITDVLVLPFQTSLPSGKPTGSVALSGSGGTFNGMYVYNGTSWINVKA
jgi:hypothetical protein